MFGFHVRSAFDGIAIVDVLGDICDFCGGVTEVFQAERNRAVDDFKHTAAGELLVFDQRDIGFDAGGIAVHHKADGTCGGQYGSLGISEPVLSTGFQDAIPSFPGGVFEVSRSGVWDLLDGVAVHLHHSHHRFGVFVVFGEGSHDTGHLSACEVRCAVEQRGDRTAKSMGGS